MCGQLPPLCTLHNQCALGTIFTFNNVRGEFCPEDYAFGREEAGGIRLQTKCVIRVKNMGFCVDQVDQAKLDILLGYNHRFDWIIILVKVFVYLRASSGAMLMSQ